ncbi:Holliday junction resolvase-like protein [bacterium BMS3Abin06]|nr:Holliday junction resolvase-like protein [bacterium BMS3Abin06]
MFWHANKMRVVGLDVGYKPAVIAISGSPGFTAQGMETVSRNDYMAALKRIIEECNSSKLF